MTNVLLLIKGLGRGGAEQLLVNAAPYLDRSRFSYRAAYLMSHKNALVEELARHGVPSTYLDGRGPLGWLRALARLIEEQAIDIVHVHSPYVAAILRGRYRRRPPYIVYTEHNLWDRYRPATRLINALTFSRNDWVFAVSDEVQSSIHAPPYRSWGKRPPVEVIRPALDLAALEKEIPEPSLRAELGLDPETPLVGTVANFKRHKGHQYLLEAVSQVIAALPDVRFVLVGTGPLEKRVRDRVEELALGGVVKITGFRSDALSIIAQLDLFVLASTHEGLPVALLEAMALRRPVVATSVGGIPEVIESGNEGMLVPPRDSEALARAIVGLLNDDKTRSRMAGSAARKARQFDVRTSVKRIEQVYEEILSGNRAPN